jgi:hypothetical protein
MKTSERKNNEEDVLSIVYWGLSDCLRNHEGRFKSSNRQGNKLSSDRYVKGKVKEKQRKESKAKGERKWGHFRVVASRWPSQGSHDAYDSRATPFEHRTPKRLGRTLKRQHTASAILATEPQQRIR